MQGDGVMQMIVNPCLCDNGHRKYVAMAYAKIQYDVESKKLSITGVIDPKSNGNALGGGQCSDEIRRGRPSVDWNREMLHKFCDIWDRWHLNDMRPYCNHQKKLGWDVLAGKEVILYHYKLTHDALMQQQASEKAALEALRTGVTFTPSQEQVMFANLRYEITSPVEQLSEDIAKYYEPKKALYAGDRGATERKLLGWLKPEEHPEGILGKPCPRCGYEYGSAWKQEKIPEDVIDWLFNLPESKATPAWI